MFDRQFSPEEITTYEVAREVIGRQIGQLVRERDAATDPAERERLDAAWLQLWRKRETLRVGSDETRQVVEDAKARHAATQQAAAHGEPRRRRAHPHLPRGHHPRRLCSSPGEFGSKV